MSKLRILSGQEICAILAHHSFVEVRQRGSHVIMQKQLEETTITVPVLQKGGVSIIDLFLYRQFSKNSRGPKLGHAGIRGIFNHN